MREMLSAQNDLHRLGIKLKFVYSVIGLVLGLACIIAGVILGLGGVAGHTTWTASLLGLSSNLSDATPGVIVFIVGVFLVLITRFKVRDDFDAFKVRDDFDAERGRRHVMYNSRR